MRGRDDGLDYIVLVVHDGLDLLRVDILAVCAENHALAAALDEDIAVSVNDSQVTGLRKPSAVKAADVASGFL